jgi:acyl-homoserine lactone acylase PvdQ
LLSRRILAALAAALAALLAAVPAASAATYPPDYSAPNEAWNVLAPGEGGSNPPGPNSFSQVPLYDGLTPNFDTVTDASLPVFFKKNVFGLGGESPASTFSPPGHPGVVIERDSKGVAHITSATRADAMYGIGFVSIQDRVLLMEQLRGPARLAAIDAPGINPFQILNAGRTFTPSAQTEAFLAAQVPLLQSLGAEGQQIIDDVDAYVAGINDARTLGGVPTPPWTRNDVIAIASLLAARFGRGGGDEARRAQFLSGLVDRLGKKDGRDAFDDLRGQNDKEAPVTIERKFKLGGDGEGTSGNAIIDAGSLDTSGALAAATEQSAQGQSSNALLIGSALSASGHPLFVAGPQVGYNYPGLLFEYDVHAPGISARGASFPGSGPYVELGRGPDFSWSATSSGTDLIDQFVETLCDGSDTKYRFKGACLDMTTFSAGTLSPGAGPPAGPVVFRETVHGPVIGYATEHGERVAVSSSRSTRGREMVSSLGFESFNSDVDSAQSFIDAASKIELSFNWFYGDKDNIALFSSGRVPIRDGGVNMGLPTEGTGKHEWRGFVKDKDHPQTISPSNARIINWNNKPAPEWTAADDEWSYGSVHRNDLLTGAVDRESAPLTLGELTNAMNYAATQDLRNVEVLPVIKRVLDTGPAPSAREQQMLDLLAQWRADGSSRLDKTPFDGLIDAPGAAIMDQAWNKIADAVMGPVLGPQLGELATLVSRSNNANSQGSSYGSGWYGYVDKDLRALLGDEVKGKYKTKFCGAGDLAACRDSLWQALKAAGDELQAAHGTGDPSQWRKSAIPERIAFPPVPATSVSMRWTNRPTFQQVISYDGHR